MEENSQLTEEQILEQFWDGMQKEADALSVKYGGKKIVCFAVQDKDTDERLKGFMYELDAITDAKLYGAQLSGAEIAIAKGLQAADSMVLWSDSDPRLSDKKYKKSVALCVLGQVESATPLLKKK